MSWSLSLSGMTTQNFDSRFLSSVEDLLENPSEETTEQLMEAKEAAKALINSGAVGEPDKYEFVIYLSGHSNADHSPAPGWANDQITVAVTQSKLLEVKE